ncbi:MAG TPA: YcgN family cysteine cluster protein [Sneathiellales bacterium]|jgi:uncharacterized cysteine cluster protein YcgN (CxxCxxCC family)|nr:YcgN family cysteine cluster protein [Sneathiellales bacterium]
MVERPFWEIKSLKEMTRNEWESLCDGCARCCLHKLEDEDTDEVFYTDVACRLLDMDECKCTRYKERNRLVPDCVVMSPETVRRDDWLPSTCAYRLVREGKDLYWWHPLVSGDPQTVHEAGISVAGRAVTEREAGQLEHRLVAWPE